MLPADCQTSSASAPVVYHCQQGGKSLPQLTRCPTTWGAFVEAMSYEHDERHEKDGPGFIMADFSTPYRRAENVTVYTAVCLDMDTHAGPSGRPETPPSPTFAVEQLRRTGLAGFVYTTHNHEVLAAENDGKPTGPRYRVIIPLLAPIAPSDLERVTRGAARMLWMDGPGFDPVSWVVGQFFFMPSCRPGGVRLSAAVDGQMLDPAGIADQQPELPEEEPAPPPSAAAAPRYYPMHHGSLFDDTKARARGQWRGILSSLGIGVPSSGVKHSACPGCGGKDRFRFDDKDGSGSWLCSQGLRVVLVPDAGKEADAQAIAADVGCQWVQMPADAPANFDANDYAAEHGAEDLAGLLEAAHSPAKLATPPARFPMLSGADLRALPDPSWRIKGVFPASGLAVIYGASASGKSFLALHMAAELARGRDWFGYRVKAAPVVYLPLEGEAGFKLRCAAWEQEHGEPLPDALRLTMAPFKLTDSEDVEALAAAAAGVGPSPVIFIDTMNRAAPDEDENAPDGMGRILDGAKNLQRLTGGLVVLVHHTGKDTSKGMRGHSSLFAALDGAIEVTRSDDRRGWKCAKSKDGKDGQEHAFTLHIHELGTDEDGDALTSCVVREDTSASTSETRRPPPPKGPNQRVFMDALRPLFRAGTAHGKGGALPTIACITLEAALEAGANAMTCEPKRRPERAQAALTSLIAGHHLRHKDGWIWIP